MITRDDVDWLTADEVAAQVGTDVTPEMLRDWKRRGLIRGVTLAGVGHYRRDDVEDAEARTRSRRAGRPRSQRA